jgi:hypothetical protein
MTTRTPVTVPSPIRPLALGGLAVSLLLAAGCGTSDRSCPVSGQVFVNDLPANGLYVVFQPAGDASGPQGSARTNPDGTFSLRIRDPGDYAVTVFWPQVTDEAGEFIEGEDSFKGRYCDPKRPVVTVTIRQEENSLPPIRLSFP